MQLPTVLWVRDTTPHKLCLATEASLGHDETNLRPSGLIHLQEVVASPVLSPLPDARVPKEVTPPSPRSSDYLESPGD